MLSIKIVRMRVLNKVGLLGKPKPTLRKNMFKLRNIVQWEDTFLHDGCWANPSPIFVAYGFTPQNMIPFNGLTLTNYISLLGKPKVNGNQRKDWVNVYEIYTYQELVAQWIE